MNKIEIKRIKDEPQIYELLIGNKALLLYKHEIEDLIQILNGFMVIDGGSLCGY